MHQRNKTAHQPRFGKPTLSPSPLEPLVETETKSVHFYVFANVRLECTLHCVIGHARFGTAREEEPTASSSGRWMRM